MTKGQVAVLSTLKQYGPLPDVALVPMAQHVSGVHQSSSSIRSRRAELVRQGQVFAVGTAKQPSGRHATIWSA